MKHQQTRYGFVLRLDAGEEIVATLREFAARHGVRNGMISAIGAVGEAELGYFDRAGDVYVREALNGEWEILGLTGNLSDLEGTPFPHLHATLGGRDFAVRGGHFFRGVVTVTCEVQLVTDPETMRRVRRADATFTPLEPRGQ